MRALARMEMISSFDTTHSIKLRVNPRVFRNVFLCAFSHMVLRWTHFGKDGDSDKINELVDLMIEAVSYPEN